MTHEEVTYCPPGRPGSGIGAGALGLCACGGENAIEAATPAPVETPTPKPTPTNPVNTNGSDQLYDPVVATTPAPDKYDANGDVPSDWVPPVNDSAEAYAEYQEMLKKGSDPEGIADAAEAGERASQYYYEDKGYSTGAF